MASLPQGWHGVLTTTKKSQIQTTKLPYLHYQTLPSIEKSSVKKNWISNIKSPNGTTKSNRNNITQSLQNHTSIPLRIVRTKAESVELNNIKKELSKVKDENAILRCRLRKIDDENGKKAREIEKLHMELKKISTNSRLPLKHKQNNEEMKTFQINGKATRKENTLHSEILRLKDIINKLQEGNKKLTNQLKEKDQEIRSLRYQLSKSSGRTLPSKLPNRIEVENKSVLDNVRIKATISSSNKKLEKIRPVLNNGLK